jgi:phenylacetate-CoA ligase
LHIIPIEFRVGGINFINTYNFLKETEKWDKKKIVTYQKKQLQKLLEHAIKHVRFYSNIPLRSDDPFKNLQNFQIIDKETIQNNFKIFMADNIPKRKTYYVTTGGTSGNPLGFYLDNSTFGKEWAFVMTGWKRVGFTPGDKVVSIRGVEFYNNKNIFWQDNPVYNMLEMSPFHMNKKYLPMYVEVIKKFKPKYIHGYPSAISILAKYVENVGEKIPPIKAVFAISENIYPGQREFIEKIFNTRLFSFYGMSEKAIMAPECEYDTRYHSFPEYGITEVVDKNGDPVAEGERGELVGTGFLNYCMPFIRYRTGDYAILSDQRCTCGRPHLLLEQLVGRWNQEMLLGRSGALISIAAFNLHGDVFKNVYRYQFYQKKQGEMIIRVVLKKDFSIKDEEEISKAIYKKVGQDLQIFFEEVDEIKLTARGKFKLLIQELPLNSGD